MMSACGVLCSDCPAYLGKIKGIKHQELTAEAWHRIYGLNEAAGNISCSGCLGPAEELFYTSRSCKARHCCLSKGYSSCADCPQESCEDLEKAQSVWDAVPDLINTLSPSDFAAYAQPYCGHRNRLARSRSTRTKAQHDTHSQ
jgi:hypothetical protein